VFYCSLSEFVSPPPKPPAPLLCFFCFWFYVLVLIFCFCEVFFIFCLMRLFALLFCSDPLLFSPPGRPAKKNPGPRFFFFGFPFRDKIVKSGTPKNFFEGIGKGPCPAPLGPKVPILSLSFFLPFLKFFIYPPYQSFPFLFRLSVFHAWSTRPTPSEPGRTPTKKPVKAGGGNPKRGRTASPPGHPKPHHPPQPTNTKTHRPGPPPTRPAPSHGYTYPLGGRLWVFAKAQGSRFSPRAEICFCSTRVARLQSRFFPACGVRAVGSLYSGRAIPTGSQPTNPHPNNCGQPPQTNS